MYDRLRPGRPLVVRTSASLRRLIIAASRDSSLVRAWHGEGETTRLSHEIDRLRRPTDRSDSDSW
jgi:hypothetical protein